MTERGPFCPKGDLNVPSYLGLEGTKQRPVSELLDVLNDCLLSRRPELLFFFPRLRTLLRAPPLSKSNLISPQFPFQLLLLPPNVNVPHICNDLQQ